MIPEPLPIRRMDQIFDVISQGEVGPKDPRRLYVGLEDIQKGGGGFVSHLNPSESLSMHLRFESGDILFGKLRPELRKSISVDFSGYCSTDIIVLRPKDGIDSSFATHVASSDIVFRRAISTSAGMGMPRTKWSKLSDLEIYCPNEETQCYIGRILDDTGIAQSTTKQLIRKLEMMREGMLNDLLTYGVDDNGLLRSYETHEFVDSPLGPIPESWSIETMDTACSVITDGEHQTPPRTSEGVPLLSARNVHNSKLVLDKLDFISEDTYDQLCQRIRPSHGDVLISCSGTIGRVSVVPEGFPFHLVRSVAIVRPRAGIPPHYLEMALQGHKSQSQIGGLVGRTAQGNLFQGQISRIMIPVPTQVECERIVNSLSPINRRIGSESILLEKYQKLKYGLMSDLLTGRRRVPEPSPADMEVPA